MRVPLIFAFLVASLPVTTPLAAVTVFGLGAKIVELTSALLDTLITINSHEDLVETNENRKEKILFNSLDSISIEVGTLSQQLHGIGGDLNVIVQILNNLPETIRLELHLDSIRNIQTFVDIYYIEMEKYVRDFEEYENSTLIGFSNRVLSDSSNSVPFLIEQIYRKTTSREFLDLFYKHLQPTPESYFCKGKHSYPQALHNFINEIIIINMKGYIVTQAAYMMKKIYKQGNFVREIRDTNEEFQMRTNDLITTMKSYMAKGSSELWRCDPQEHVKDETYVEITNFLHGFVLNKVNLDPRGKCRDECDVFTYTLEKDVKCRENDWCKKQLGCSKIIECHYVDSSMNVCKQSMTQDHRRYEYIEFGSGRTFGRKSSCDSGTTHLETYRDWIVWKCSYCFCLCDEGPKFYSEIYINLLAAMSNITDNRVVTGVRFVKHNQIIYLQVQEGKLLPRGQIDLDTMRWVPVTEYAREGKSTGRYYHTLTWEERAFDLADVLVDDGSVLTGVRFRKVGTRLHLEIVQTSFNFTTGRLNKRDSYLKLDPHIQRKHMLGKELELSKPDVPTRSPSSSTEFTTDKYIRMTHTDFDKDAGQTTVPFFDAQPVESATPVPLQGMGIFHKGRTGYGGFIAPKIFTYNFTKHLEPVFPIKKGKLRND